MGKCSEWGDSSLVYEAKGKQFGGKYARYKYGRYKVKKKTVTNFMENEYLNRFISYFLITQNVL